MKQRMQEDPPPYVPGTPNPPVQCCKFCGHAQAPQGDDGRAVGYPEDAVRKSNHEAFCGRKLLDILYEPNCIVLVFNREPLMSMRLYQTAIETVLPEKPQK